MGLVVAQNAKLFFLCWFIFGISSLSGVLPMREQFQKACMALRAGDPGKALALFEEFDKWYGSEQAVQDSAFRNGFLRLWGLCALQMGNLSRGTDLLETWLAEFPENPGFRAYIRFQLAEAYGYLRETEKRIHHWSSFLMENPELPECLLVRWKWADSLIQVGQLEKARDHLEALLASDDLSPSSQSLVMTAIGLIHLSAGDTGMAFECLQNTENNPACQLWRSICAPSMVKSLMENNEPEKALSACAWLLSPEDQEASFNQLEEHFRNRLLAGRKSLYPRLALWDRHWQNQVLKLGAAMSAADSLQNESSSYPLVLNALLKAGKSHEAVVLGKALLSSVEHNEQALRAWAYKSIIEGHLGMKQWEQADLKVRQFRTAYPDDPALPDILFLSARTSAERHAFDEAVEQISRLLEAYPENRSRLSWKMMQAEWLLQAGRPREAMAVLHELQNTAPESWQPWLVFQTGRCHEDLKDWETATDCYNRVEQHELAPSAQREFALTALLKLSLRTGERASFTSILERYHQSFPQGMNRPVVMNLAGSFHASLGQTEKAEKCFLEVTASGHPLAAYALEQLSALYRKTGDTGRLFRHSRDWIVQGLANGTPLPPTPFQDFQLVHEKTGKPSLDKKLGSLLLQEIETESLLVPASEMLRALKSEWSSHDKEDEARGSSFEEWCEARSNKCLRDGATTAYACYQLFLADQLDSQGRTDSADARRIEVLKTGNPQALDEYSLYRIALTAGIYDFPETEAITWTFITRFRNSERVPEMLLQLAQERYANGQAESALQLLEQVRRDWPDADVYPEACLLAAQWYLLLKSPADAIHCLSPLFERTSLEPRLVARSLLLRAQADLLTGNTERARLSLLRLVHLYPDYHDIRNEAIALASKNKLSGISA